MAHLANVLGAVARMRQPSHRRDDGARAEALVAPLNDSRRHEAAVGSKYDERNTLLGPELIDVINCWHCRRQLQQEFCHCMKIAINRFVFLNSNELYFAKSNIHQQ